MQLTNLFDENDGSRAVSPVIGVILMVAITVILAAVIGTFVLGIGENVNSTPQATWDFDANETSADTIDEITITHNGGDSIDPARLSVSGAVDSGSGDPVEFTNSSNFAPGGTVSAGEKIVLNNSTTNSFQADISGQEGDEVQLVYTAEGGGDSNIIARYELPADGEQS